MEGRLEVLEQSAVVLEFARAAIARPAPHFDDLVTLKQVDRHRQKLRVDGVSLQTSLASKLESSLRLLCTDWFIGSRAEAPASVIGPAMRAPADPGWVLVLSEGALFIPRARLAPLQKAIAGVTLWEMPAERFLLLLAHLRRPLDSVVAALEEHDADWLAISSPTGAMRMWGTSTLT